MMMITPLWMELIQQQIIRQKHALLYGNLDDYFIWQDRTETDFVLLSYGIKCLFPEYAPMIVEYDGIATLLIYGEKGTSEFFEQITGETPLSNASNASDGILRSIAPAQAATICQKLLIQDERFVVFVWNLADLLTNERERYTDSERRPIVDLRTAMAQSAISSEGHRNMLIFTAHDLNRVPVWLYQTNPLLTLIQITAPSREERKQYGLHFIRSGQNGPGFFGGDKLSAVEEVAEELADLSEGLTLREMVALRNTSHSEKIPIERGRISQLIDFFRFGKQDDPWLKLDDGRVREAKTILAKRVIGQEKAIAAVARVLTTAKVGLTLSKTRMGGKPKGVFFFVGPTGVGKTELAKSLAELVFGDEHAFVRFDMSEYSEEHSAERLTGAPPGFVGYVQGGQLTNAVAERPYQILLFDEVEKAHSLVLDKFLQILEDGRLTDGKGQTAYFHHTVIIFTSNIGASDLFPIRGMGSSAMASMPSPVPRADDEVATHGEQRTYEEIERYFKDCVYFHFTYKLGRPELFNRLGNGIVVFDLLRKKNISLIGEKFLNVLREQAREEFGIHLRFDGSVNIAIQRQMEKADSLRMGGRGVRVQVEKLVQDPLNVWLLEHPDKLSEPSGKTLVVKLAAFDRLEVEISPV